MGSIFNSLLVDFMLHVFAAFFSKQLFKIISISRFYHNDAILVLDKF